MAATRHIGGPVRPRPELAVEGGSAVSYFSDYADHAGASAERFFKSTLFQSERLLLGLNCLEPGQTQPVHDHADQDKFYFVVEGVGDFVVGDERQPAAEGGVVWAPAGVPHGVTNRGTERLVLLVGIAPFGGH
jgi:quercetin dioxygenase-like cupin family protein